MSDDSAVADISIICGPTGAGKSSLAMQLARRHGLHVLSADSRQVYRGFDIGTAKPSRADMAAVTHHAIDIADPTERWSAALWATRARTVLAENGNRRVVVVGGTGLYLRALTTAFFTEPSLDGERRRALAGALADLSSDELRRWVEHLDPSRAQLGRTQLLRAVEVALLTGRRLSDWHREAPDVGGLRARWLVVDPSEALQARLEQRLSTMLEAGWLDEVRDLARRIPPAAPAWLACGYHALLSVAEGFRTLEDARTSILIATRQYAKRQRTWFRHQLPADEGRVTRLDPRDPDCEALVEAWWRTGEST